MLLLPLVCPAWGARESLEKAPRTDLFQQAEQDSRRISQRMKANENEESNKRKEEIIESENQNRARAIQKYRALLGDKKRLDPATVEISMLNLAHLIFEQCLARYRSDMRSYDEAYKQYQLGYRKAAPDDLPQYNFEEARKAYDAFLEEFPDSEHRAEVMYNMAYSYEEEGDLDTAVTLYDELALTAPTAQFAPEIFLRLGEHSFETNRFTKSIEYYQKVLDQGDTPLYEKALFKIGWSRYAMDQFKEAEETFAQVLALHTERGKERGDLYNESLEILAKILSETGGASALEAFLKAHNNPAYGLDLSVQLGTYFQETARYEEAIDTYREILDTYPQAPQAPFVEQSLIQALKTEKKIAEAEGLQASMVDRYGRGTAWDRANKDPDLRQQVDGILWEALNQQLIANHKLAREKKDPKAYDKTIALYKTVLDYFPEGEKAYETRFLFAECLYESGRLEEAAQQYEKIANMETYTRHSEKAASKRIQCLETLRADERIDADTLLVAYQDYLRLNPESEKATPIMFKQGEILFNVGRFAESALIFNQIIRDHPKHKDALRAWILELEALFEAGQYAELEERARDLTRQRFSLTQDQKNRTDHLLRFSQFQQAHADQEAGDYIEAARRYERLVEEAPKVEIAPDALFNAAICYDKAEDPAKAAACYEKIVLDYPNSKHYKNALLAPLAHYEKTEQWDRLLVHLEKLYREDQKSSLAKETLYKLGRRFYKSEDYARAREIFALYARQYPADTSRKLEIAYLEAQISEAQGNAAGAMEGYDRFLKAYAKAKANEPSLEVEPLYLATARFRTLDPVYQEYKSVELKEPLKKNLAKKQSLLDRVVSGYMETAKSGAGQYALASAFRVGEAYENFWKSMLASAVPRGLSEEEARVYGGLLKEQAAPYREKAVASYETTLKKARDRRVFNEWVLTTYNRLASLDPDRYPPMLQDSLVWQESWQIKRSLIRTIDKSKPRTFSSQEAASLQSALDKILGSLREKMKTGRLDRPQILRSIKLLQELVKKEPSLYEVHFNLGILYQMIGESEKARKAYTTSLRQHPKNPVAQLNLGLLELEDGNLIKAETHFKELALISPRYAGAYYLSGVCQGKRKDYKKSVASLQKAISLLPQFLDPYVELGRVQNEIGQEEEARKNFLSVLNNPKASPRILRMLGYRLLEAGWKEESLEAYTRLLHGGKATYGDWNNRGVAHSRNGDWTQARKDIAQASEVAPKQPEPLNNLGRIYVEAGSYTEAVSSFLQALEVDPSFHPALLNTAVVYGQYLDDMDKATDYLQQYLDQGGTRQREMIRGWLADSQKAKEKPTF
jgi:tetratricopeptide (TPR) repeat protein